MSNNDHLSYICLTDHLSKIHIFVFNHHDWPLKWQPSLCNRLDDHDTNLENKDKPIFTSSTAIRGENYNLSVYSELLPSELKNSRPTLRPLRPPVPVFVNSACTHSKWNMLNQTQFINRLQTLPSITEKTRCSIGLKSPEFDYGLYAFGVLTLWVCTRVENRPLKHT